MKNFTCAANAVKPIGRVYKALPKLLFLIVLCWCFTIPVKAQQTVTGTVITEEDDSGLPGVNVLIKGTSQGTVTDISGKYTIEVPDENTVLVFSSVGFVEQEFSVGNRTIIDITMESDVTALDEIVVIGYGTQKKSDLTGAIASADLEAMDTQPNVSFLEGLQGSIPGLNVGQVNEAGESPELSIRGRTSISGAQNPLIVLDGVIYRGELVDINPSDIKAIDVLKDASASAIYGSQAANGVVMITTKTGTKGKGRPTITYSGLHALQQPHHELRAETNGENRTFRHITKQNTVFRIPRKKSGLVRDNKF